MRYTFALFVLSSLSWAEQPLRPAPLAAPGTTEARIPVIVPELEIRYLRAVMENQAAQVKAEASLASQEKATAEVVAACGDKHLPLNTLGADGRLKCVPKPK
jgi:hypothetical protein